MPARSWRRVTAVAAALLLATVLAACSSSSGSRSSSTNTDSSLADVTLTLGDQANGLKTLLEAAGTLKNTPYKVKWAEFQGAAPLFQAMQGGSVDTGYAADLPTLQAISGGLPIKLVAAAKSNGAGTGIVLRKGSDVHSVADLKGRTVVVSSAKGSIAEYLLANVLQDNGLSYSDVTVQYLLPTAAQAAFSSGKIGIWATFGIYQAQALKQGGTVLVDGQDGRTSGIGFISAATKSLGDKHKQAALADVLQRIAKAEAWSATNAAAYAGVFSQKNGVDPAIARTVVSQGSTALLPVSPDVVKTVQAVSDLMHHIGSLPTDVSVAAVTDTSVFTGATN